jgi:hypothetical protein
MGKQLKVVYIKVSWQHLSAGAMGNSEKPQTGQLVFGARSETRTFRIGSKSATHSAAVFIDCFSIFHMQII